MSRHRLARGTRPRRIQCKSTPHRCSIAQSQRRGFYGQLGGIGVAAAVIAIPLLWGVDAVAGFPIDLSSPPSAPAGQRPLGPSWLPSGVGLHTSGVSFNPLFRAGSLDASVATQPDVLHTALSQPLSLTLTQPVGQWVGGRWVPGDVVAARPPCPSPVLDPAGWVRWWRAWFPHVTPPAPPVVTSPPATTPVVTAPPVAVPAPVQEPSDPPPASPPSPVQSPPVEVGPVDTQPVTVDPPSVDVPPVTVPVVDVPVDVPPVDAPPVSVPPVDTAPVTDPVAPVVDSIGSTVDGITESTPDVTQPSVDTNLGSPDVSKDATAGAAEIPVELSGAEPLPTRLGPNTHSTSGNTPGGAYVGKHRVGQLSAQGAVQPQRPVGGHGDGGRGHGVGGHSEGRHAAVSGSHHADHAGGHGNGGGRHRAVDHDHSHGGSHGHNGSHGGSHGSHGGHGGSHGGGHRG